MDLEDLKNLAKELPEYQPPQERQQALRESLLASIENEEVGRSKRRLWLPIVAVAAAAVLAFYAGNRFGQSPTNSRPSVMASLSSPDGAQFTHQVNVGATSNEIVEEVRLHSGRLHVQAADTVGRRVTVVADDGVVHGAGATFEVQVVHGKLASILVESGRTEVQLQDQAPVILAAGDNWVSQRREQIELAVTRKAPEREVTEIVVEERTPVVEEETPAVEEETPEVKVKHPVVVTSPVAPHKWSTRPAHEKTETPAPVPELMPDAGVLAITTSPPSQPRPRQATSAELAFDSGYRAVKRGDYNQAISDLSTAIAGGKNSKIAVDASYWRIVALARAGRGKQAQKGMEVFIKSHSTSSRVGEVVTMLAWNLVEQGHAQRAKTLFQRAENDSSPEVRRSARAGLKALRGVK